VNQQRKQFHVSAVNKIGTACMHQVLELQQLAGIIGMPGNRTAMFDKIKNVCNLMLTT